MEGLGKLKKNPMTSSGFDDYGPPQPVTGIPLLLLTFYCSTKKCRFQTPAEKLLNAKHICSFAYISAAGQLLPDVLEHAPM
jgi:hypothetical protein